MSRRFRNLLLACLAGTTSLAPVSPQYALWAFERGPASQAASRPAIPQTFAAVKSKADKAQKPLDAVVLWQTFVEQTDLSKDDKDKGQKELQLWLDRDTADSVLIKKQWVGGKDKEKIVKDVTELLGEAKKMIEGGQTLSAVSKLEAASKIWPENFEVQFYLGRIALEKRDSKEALLYFEACRRIAPNSVAVLNNLGVGYLIQKVPQYEKAISTFHEAVKYGDTKELASSLRFAFQVAPPGLQKSNRLKDARDAMNLLSSKYNLSGEGSLQFMMPGAEKIDGNERADKEHKGVVGYGSGFVISADGYILTNKHVGGMGNAVMIKFTDDTQKTGEIVVLDDEQDLCLIKVKSDKPMTFVKLNKNDNPADGSLAIVMGYPAPDLLGFNVKTTSGAVATGNNSKQTSDVTLDVRVNPGNSGGPVYDVSGNVMAIIAQKTYTSEERHLDSYGLAISNGRIRKFLAKNNITVEQGADLAAPLNVQEVSQRNRLATVCIVGVKN